MMNDFEILTISFKDVMKTFHLFQIKAFQPKNVAYQHEEDTEEGLCERIARGKPTAAYASFQKIREKGEISLFVCASG